MRSLLAATVVLGCLAVPSAASAQEADLDWAMQDQARGLVGLRAVGFEQEHGREAAAGGELALGGWLAGWLAMEVRVGLGSRAAWNDGTDRLDLYLRHLWYGLGVRARLEPDWAVSPTLGAALLWHELSNGDDGLAARGEIGLGVEAGHSVLIVLGVTGSASLYRQAAGLHAGAFLGFDVLI